MFVIKSVCVFVLLRMVGSDLDIWYHVPTIHWLIIMSCILCCWIRYISPRCYLLNCISPGMVLITKLIIPKRNLVCVKYSRCRGPPFQPHDIYIRRNTEYIQLWSSAHSGCDLHLSRVPVLKPRYMVYLCLELEMSALLVRLIEVIHSLSEEHVHLRWSFCYRKAPPRP